MALSSSNAASAFPSSTEPSVSPWKYDVFLSFRGEDTRKGFLSHLYHELQSRRGIKTFKDDQQLEKGTAISQNLLTAIEESRFAIVVLSPNYASSTWCLAELAKIFECMEDKNTILPIFYNVDPSDVRHQRGSFEVALTKHVKSGQDVEKVKQWRDALEKVAKISGWASKNYKSEREPVEHIVKSVQNSVLRKHISLGPYGSGKELQNFDDGVHSTVRQLVIHFIPKRLIKKSIICIQMEHF
ncbi:hypothetical protein ACLB2K_015560 [Fragaria x ananassa]